MPLKNPVTPPGIDPGTVRLIVQRINHYATPSPVPLHVEQNIQYYSKLTPFVCGFASLHSSFCSRYPLQFYACNDSRITEEISEKFTVRSWNQNLLLPSKIRQILQTLYLKELHSLLLTFLARKRKYPLLSKSIILRTTSENHISQNLLLFIVNR